MYRFITILFTILIIANAQAQAGKTALIAGGAALIAGFAAYASIEQMNEGLEHQATEWYLANHPEERLFRLKIRTVTGTKLSDFSNVSSMLYTVYTYDPETRVLKDKFILLSFHSRGWVNENGVNFQKISYYLISKLQWEEFIKLWVETISPVKIDWNKGIPIYSKCAEKKYVANDPSFLSMVNNVDGVKTIKYYETKSFYTLPINTLSFSGISIDKDYGDVINAEESWDVFLMPLNKVDGDTYLRSVNKLSFIDSYLIGNEKTICLFRTEEQQLVQLNLELINFVQSVFSKDNSN